MLALAYASRQGLPEYLAYRSEVEHAAALVNERWSTPDWTPVVLDVADHRARSIAALCRYDVLLVNPVRDGLNLVAKEGPLVNRRHGVLVLSKEAGAMAELAADALGVNPFDVSATAAALDRALGLEPEERARRAEGLRQQVAGRTASDWLADQVAAARRPTV
jgi:trehalose 6-phosphate synthase